MFVEYHAQQRGSLDPPERNMFPGVLFSRGELWQEQRRFSLHALRDLGFGKNSTEELAIEEAGDLCSFLESTNGQPIDIRNKFNIAILNALWRISTSEKLPYDDPRLNKLLKLLDDFIREVGSPINAILISYRPLMWVAAKSGYLASGALFTKLRQFVEESVNPLKETYQNDYLRNFVDHYLHMMESQNKPDGLKSFSGPGGETNLVSVLIDLFIAGSETTSTTLSWAMLYMILNPEIQKKVQEELDEVAGVGNQPRVSDRARTPYTEAVLHEVQRVANILSRSVPHAAQKDCILSTGHFIPENTVVMCCIGSVMMDPEVFPKPSKFDPTRYLDKDGAFVPHPRVVPFGLGRRRCLGEALARMELYLFFTGILSRFNLEKASLEDPLSTAAIHGVVTSPRPYKMRFISRS